MLAKETKFLEFELYLISYLLIFEKYIRYIYISIVNFCDKRDTYNFFVKCSSWAKTTF